MGKGKILESGNHEELLKNYPDGVYSKLVADQQRIDTQQAQQTAAGEWDNQIQDVDDTTEIKNKQ